MDSATLDALVAWIGEHPVAAGVVIFAIAFCDAIVLLGIAVPALPILFGVGTLIGLGHVDGSYALASAALGAFAGDGVSYLFGRHYGARLKRMWPFSKHPQWLASGEGFFRRHGLKGIVIARFVGAVRPFVPAIAGMLRMRVSQYVPASAFASAGWSVVFLVPGWLFGASLELLAAVAGRLALVLGLLLVVLLGIYAGTVALYRLLAPRASSMLERALAWSHAHPVLGRFSEALIDPRRPESASLALLAMLLIGGGWAFFSLLFLALGSGDPLALDLAVHRGMFGLRTPLADHLMAVLAAFGDWQVLAPAVLVVFGWLLWRRRRIAAWHWLAAVGFGLLLVAALGFLLDMPKPPAAMAVAGFSFPSAPVTMATVVYGFFAVLIARELPGRRRAWPYAVAGLLVALVGFARLYFGAHWLSDVLAGVSLGMLWIAVLGLAYRRRVTRSFWIRPLATLFFLVALPLGLWHGSRNAEQLLARFTPPAMQRSLAADDWWSEGWRVLPGRRNEVSGRDAWPLNVQYAGDTEWLKQRLQAAGWREETASGWGGLLRTLDAEATPATLPVLAASHSGRPDALVMSRSGAADGSRRVLHLWPSVLRLAPAGIPVWQGTVSEVGFRQRFGFSYWETGAGFAGAREALSAELAGVPQRQAARSGLTVLLLHQPGLRD
jgi:membrane protein DedA with SNARE-associated domain/membrane-associated phospholipid phosphatase